MSATDTVFAYECNLITEDEAVEQARADDVRDLYRRAVLEQAPHMAAGSERARPTAA